MPAIGAIAKGDGSSTDPIFIFTLRWGPTPSACHGSLTLAAVIRSDYPLSVSYRPMRRLLRWGPPVIYMALIFHLSSESAPIPEVTSRVWDKLLHFVEYGGLAVLWCRALAGEGVSWLTAGVLSVLVSSAYGASDEWHQAFVPLRNSTVVDWVADTVGAALAIVGYGAIARWRQHGLTSAA
jgi:VanZ family protein